MKTIAVLLLASVATALAAADLDVENADNHRDLMIQNQAMTATIERQSKMLEAIKDFPLATRLRLASDVHRTRSCVAATPGFGTSCKASSEVEKQGASVIGEAGPGLKKLIIVGSSSQIAAIRKNAEAVLKQKAQAEQLPGELGTKAKATSGKKECRQSCTKACRARHEEGSEKYPVCDLPDFTDAGLKRIGAVKGDPTKPSREGGNCATKAKPFKLTLRRMVSNRMHTFTMDPDGHKVCTRHAPHAPPNPQRVNKRFTNRIPLYRDSESRSNVEGLVSNASLCLSNA